VRAIALARAGRTDAALDALARALAEGADDLGQVEADQNLAALRTHPRFRELLSQAREDR
jgi:hypothetical protein